MRTMQCRLVSLVAAALSVVVAVAAPPRPDETVVATFDSAGIPIRYLSAGQGEPVVLLHGWMGEASNWGPGSREKPVLRPAPGYRMIAPDLRGHGGSAKPHDAQLYGAEMARDVVRLLDHLKIRRAHVVGYSMGAYVAGKLVDIAPDRVASVLYGGSVPVLNTRSVKRFGDVDAFEAAVASGRLGQYLIDVAPVGSPKLTPELADAIAARRFANQDPKALAAAGRGLPGLEVDAARLRTLAVPSLVVYGSRESTYVLDRVAEARRDVPGWEFVVVEGANHMTTLRSPTFTTTLLAFLKRHPIPAGGGR